ncbi:hypothetical protein BC937DRAFT_91479 [Endogone sp. FLAS-F59071]|nr:hypothetical protein BC937DRAFT_91479 [Endogone sp. FLAS-F59071]|eukprot:RUS21779.1 hypothetical protein BC937DRAFT_91479 [Endogone sp. FLAS-F59071]
MPPPNLSMKFLEVTALGARVKPVFTNASTSAVSSTTPPPAPNDRDSNDSPGGTPTVRKSLRLNRKRQHAGQPDNDEAERLPEEVIARPAKRSREEVKKNVRFGRAEGDREFVNKGPSPASPGSGFEVPDDQSQMETNGEVAAELFSEDSDDARDPPESHRMEERGNEMMDEGGESYSRNREEREEESTVDTDFSCERLFTNHHFDEADDVNSEDGSLTSNNFTELTNTFQFLYPTLQPTLELQNSSHDQGNQQQQQQDIHHYQQCEEYDVQGYRGEEQGQQHPQLDERVDGPIETEKEEQQLQEQLDVKKTEARVTELQEKLKNATQEMLMILRSNEMVHVEMLSTLAAHKSLLSERDKVLKSKWDKVRGATMDLTQKTMNALL